ncbi:MAG: IS6 family transposase [Rhodobacteraceae bacterium]|nr:IS6 family transposase [Paracoccaceae bacterium]
MQVRLPLSLPNVSGLLQERGIDISPETARFWWSRFGSLCAAQTRRKRIRQRRAQSNWQWHLDEVFVKIDGETHSLWRAVDHQAEVLETFVAKRREGKAALKFLRKIINRCGSPHVIVTDKIRS